MLAYIRNSFDIYPWKRENYFVREFIPEVSCCCVATVNDDNISEADELPADAIARFSAANVKKVS